MPFKDRVGFKGPLADAAPIGHAAYHRDSWSGTITVRGTVRTPLIISPASPEAMTDVHPTYGCRVGADGQPWLPPAALRGALRNRYEALTDSRFGVVSDALDRPFRPKHHRSAARDLLPDSVDVARNWSELSPADRVFGWVQPEAAEGEDRRVALRSSLRISPCRFDPPGEGQPPLIDRSVRTLAILSGPRPSYGRFYLARADGQPFDGGNKREAGYRPGNRLRGRKVYPHQRDAERPGWFNPGGGRPWESTKKTNQNRTVTACVRAGASFTFDIQVRNLGSAELGALLEVIDRASGPGRIRLGYARPLGFGSVELERQQVCVETGEKRRQRLAQFDAAQAGPCSDEVVDELRQSFLQAFVETHGAPLDRHEIGQASVAEARGFDDEIVVAYPGVAEGQRGFEWFKANEGPNGAKEALELLTPTRPYRNSRNPRNV